MPAIVPTIATKHHELKQELLKRFIKPRDQQLTQQATIEQGQGRSIDVDRAALDLQKEKDLER
jgi:hypothetical protein